MSGPRWRNARGSGYQLGLDGAVVPGLTTLLKGLDGDPGALMGWAKNETAKAAEATVEDWEPLTLAKDRLSFIKARAKASMDLARDVGSATHEAVERLANASPEERPYIFSGIHPSVKPFVLTWLDWEEEHNPELVLCEVTLAHRSIGYAGTADAVLGIGGRRVLVDYKTGSTIRAKDYGQVAALALCPEILTDEGDFVPWIGVDEIWVVQIRPEGWTNHVVQWGHLDAAERTVYMMRALVQTKASAAYLEASVKAHGAPGVLGR